jgi:hypothetical protein
VVTEKQKEAETSVRALATKASTAIGQAQGIRQKLEEMRNSIWVGATLLADELAAQPVGANGFEPAAMRPVIERLH